MNHILIAILLFTNLYSAISQDFKKKSHYLTITHCYGDQEGLGLENPYLSWGFIAEKIESKNKWNIDFVDVTEGKTKDCANYIIELKKKLNTFYFISHRFDTLFLNINYKKDTVINLNEKNDEFYQKLDSSKELFHDIKKGDKISIAFNYWNHHHFPENDNLVHITYEAISPTEFVRYPKPIFRKKSDKISFHEILSFEKEIKSLKEGSQIEILLQKNNLYQVYKCCHVCNTYIDGTTEEDLPIFLSSFMSKYKK